MREKGLGTPATRAQIIEGLIYEKFQVFSREVSIIGARSAAGELVAYPLSATSGTDPSGLDLADSYAFDSAAPLTSTGPRPVAVVTGDTRLYANVLLRVGAVGA